jgi:hypothetical protein
MGVKFPLFLSLSSLALAVRNRVPRKRKKNDQRRRREVQGRNWLRIHDDSETRVALLTSDELAISSRGPGKRHSGSRATVHSRDSANILCLPGERLGHFDLAGAEGGRSGILWMHRQVVAWKFVFHIIKKRKSIRLTLGRAAHTEEIPHNPSKHRFPFQLFMPTRTWLFRLECGSRGSGSAPFGFGDSISIGKKRTV